LRALADWRTIKSHLLTCKKDKFPTKEERSAKIAGSEKGKCILKQYKAEVCTIGSELLKSSSRRSHRRDICSVGKEEEKGMEEEEDCPQDEGSMIKVTSLSPLEQVEQFARANPKGLASSILGTRVDVTRDKRMILSDWSKRDVTLESDTWGANPDEASSDPQEVLGEFYTTEEERKRILGNPRCLFEEKKALAGYLGLVDKSPEAPRKDQEEDEEKMGDVVEEVLPNQQILSVETWDEVLGVFLSNWDFLMGLRIPTSRLLSGDHAKRERQKIAFSQFFDMLLSNIFYHGLHEGAILLLIFLPAILFTAGTTRQHQQTLMETFSKGYVVTVVEFFVSFQR
jgi:hypothetical protein